MIASKLLTDNCYSCWLWPPPPPLLGGDSLYKWKSCSSRAICRDKRCNLSLSLSGPLHCERPIIGDRMHWPTPTALSLVSLSVSGLCLRSLALQAKAKVNSFHQFHSGRPIWKTKTFNWRNGSHFLALQSKQFVFGVGVEVSIWQTANRERERERHRERKKGESNVSVRESRKYNVGLGLGLVCAGSWRR